MNYRDLDDNLKRSDRPEKVELAKRLGYSYFYEMLQMKSNEGMTGGQIAIWLNKEIDRLNKGDWSWMITWRANTSSIDYNLKKLGCYRPHITKAGTKIKKAGVGGDDICTCCKIRKRTRRFLCNQCYSSNGEPTSFYGNVQHFG